MKIFKYPVLIGKMEISMSVNAKILDVQVQGGNTVSLWALTDPEAPQVSRKFILYPTGVDVDTNRVKEYLGTFQIEGEVVLVFHLFETCY
jgi:hypothetical protein